VGEATSITLGDNLHITLVQARPIPKKGTVQSVELAFPTDELLAYDVELFENQSPAPDSKGKRLEELSLVGDKDGINYAPQASLPTFFLKSEEKPLNLLHGSCRKLHGEGEDCLAAADMVLERTLIDVGKRPSVLFLTGDQIYADDVATALSQHLSAFGKELLGWEEEIPEKIGKPSLIKVGTRQALVHEKAGFVSGEAQNHLLSFGEFAAMYLTTWNEQNWPAKISKEIKEQFEKLEQTRKTLPRVRRALANIPTYMIFDDHEITDDWNLDDNVYKTVNESKAGKRIVANGIAAYWAFQGWGNEPEMFDNEFKECITNYLTSKGEKGSEKFEKKMWDFGNSPGWTFSVPMNPLTIFIDTRTQRDYPKDSHFPILLNSNGLRLIEQAARRGNDLPNGGRILIVSPAPVYGVEFIEDKQAASTTASERYEKDAEAWGLNPYGFLELMKQLIKIGVKTCIFLSGDVHYGFTIQAEFEHNNRSLHILQLTSSALKNKVKDWQGTLLAASGWPGIQAATIDRSGSKQVWLRRPTSQKLTELRSQNSRGANGSVQKEITAIESLLSKVPVRLTPTIAKDYKIQEKPDWEDSRIYVKTSTLRKYILTPNTNLGLVQLSPDMRQWAHHLLIQKKAGEYDVISMKGEISSK
jgi:hypothetical protein